MELPEGLPQLALGDVLVVDVEGVEDGLVEHAPLLVVAAPVQLLGLFEQCEAGVDEPGTVGEVGAGGVEPLGEVPSLAFDLAELVLDLGAGECSVGCEVDQVVLLGVQFLELGGDLLV
ncbi:hypothetical protein [Longimycelium tulufanense]|uniref:hypothetical protein n=1 Tax=Longimycelium tulufanense TaxID=907463 RepID=UPI001E5027D4|nr:hypothetical protein [Longimycelium tulufanense]